MALKEVNDYMTRFDLDPVYTLGRAVRPGMFYRQSDRPLQVRTTQPLLKELGQLAKGAQSRPKTKEHSPI